MRKILFLFITSVFSLNLSAQIKGVVIDSASKAPLDRAVVGLVIKSKAADTSYTLTNEKGEFIFEAVPSSNFSVIITSIAYKPVAKFVPVSSLQKTIDLGKISLASMTKVLGEVVIEAAPITIKEDTIEYRADAFKVKENAVVEDLLKKLPGVQVDKDGNIKAQGKSVTKVKVNGKDFFGGDPKTATRELPANIVDKVQIIDDYGDQATVSGIKEGDPDKVMNIQLKKNKNVGYFGRATAGVGDKGRYQFSFNGNYFNNTRQVSVFANSNNTSQSLFNFGSGSNRGMGSMIRTGQSIVNDMGGSGSLLNAMSNGDLGFFQSGMGNTEGITNTSSIGINYRDDWSKKISVYGSYTYSHRTSEGEKITSQQNFFQNKIFFNNQNSQFNSKGDNHRFFFNVEYNIDSFNYLKISPNFSYSSSNSKNNTNFNYFDSSQKTSEGYNNNLATSTSPNISGTILYNHKFHKRGRNFSANVNLGTSQNENDQDTKNSTTQYITPSGTFDRFTFISQKNYNHNYGIRFTYSEPLSKTRSLDLAYSHNLSFARNDKKTFDVNSSTGAKTFNQPLSNDYENSFFTNRANVTVRTIEKKYNYTLGLSILPVDLQGFSNTKDSAYRTIKHINIFPVARFSYNFSKTKALSINYRGDAQQPNFTQLQDVLDVSNPQYLTKGNPNLKPSLYHNVNVYYNNFNFVTGRVLFTNFSVSKIQNQIVNNVVPVGNSGAQLTMPENVNGFYNATGFYNYSRPYKNRKYVISINGNLNYNHNINLVDSQKNIGNNWVIGQGLNFEYNYKEAVQFSLGGNYNLNSVKYAGAASGLNFQNQQYSSWIITSSLDLTLAKVWVLKYDLDYTINHGLTGDVNKNVAIMNASAERQLFKKKNGILRLQVFDLFNQNSNINRSVNANSIIDTKSTRLTRYFMLSFTYRLQKFAGKQPPPKNIGNVKAALLGN